MHTSTDTRNALDHRATSSIPAHEIARMLTNPTLRSVLKALNSEILTPFEFVLASQALHHTLITLN